MKSSRIAYCILFLLFLGPVAIQAQEKSKKERIKALKVAYITEKLSLTTSEAQKFWPVYNTFYDNTSELRHQEYKNVRQKLKDQDISSLSDKEAKTLLAELEDIENKIHRENVQLAEKLKSVLPAKKILLLKIAERDFSRELLHKLKKKSREN